MIARRPDVLCLSSIDWDFIWQGHQEIMSTLAAEGVEAGNAAGADTAVPLPVSLCHRIDPTAAAAGVRVKAAVGSFA